MTDRAPPDPPTSADLARVRSARRTARAAVADAARAYALALETAFRRELSSTVRSVSPFLASLAALNGLTVADVAARMTCRSGWPRRPRLADVTRNRSSGSHFVRHGGTATGRRISALGPGGPHVGGFSMASGGWAEVQIIVHSLEVSCSMGSLTFETLFGDLLIHVRGGLPQTLAADAIGRPIEDFVMHPATNCRGWTVDAVEARGTDTVLIVTTGSLSCKLA